MNILGVDYGKKRIGLAWVDTAMNVVLPYGVLEKPEAVAELVKKERIEKVVIGLPIGLDGKENENTKNVRAFAEGLRTTIGVPMEFIDERFTSAEADRMGGDLPAGKAGATRDEKAAMLLLQMYLDRK